MATTMRPPGVKNGMATAGMICGIVGIVLCWLPLIGLIAGLLGIIFGAIGMSRAGRLGGLGRGAGVTGLVCGILSFLLLPIMAAIAIPAFMEYMQKSKKPESALHLRKIERSIRSYYIERAELPASTEEMPGSAEQVCDQRDRKHPVRTFSDWQQSGWGALDLWIDQPTPYSFKWTKETATRGFVEARADLDCDMTPAVERWDFTLVQGDLEVTKHPPTYD